MNTISTLNQRKSCPNNPVHFTAAIGTSAIGIGVSGDSFFKGLREDPYILGGGNGSIGISEVAGALGYSINRGVTGTINYFNSTFGDD